MFKTNFFYLIKHSCATLIDICKERKPCSEVGTANCTNTGVNQFSCMCKPSYTGPCGVRSDFSG
jgi:hypothetical protein